MRRADVLWHWDSAAGTLTDVTVSLSAPNGGTAITLNADDKLYVGDRDWLSGVELVVNSAPVSTPLIVPEIYDGYTQDWQQPSVQEAVEQIENGYTLGTTYDYTGPGVVTWEETPFLWVLKKASTNFPESVAPPTAQGVDSPEKYWVRLHNAGTVPVTINRVLPVLYNTYASHQKLARWIGVPEFTDDMLALQTFARERLHGAENWIDQHCRRSWKLQQMLRDRYDFNPYGVRLRYRPIWYATRAGVWTGSSFTFLIQGRNQDFWIDQQTGMLYFTRISLGRGIPWSRAASRYLRQPASMEVDYVYGEDFDLSKNRSDVETIVLKRAAIDMVTQADWTALTYGGSDALPKAEKLRQWAESSEADADELRSTWTI